MSAALFQRRLTYAIRVLPVLTLLILLAAFLLGGFSTNPNPAVPKQLVNDLLLAYFAIISLGFSALLIASEFLRERENRRREKGFNKFSYSDPFDIPEEVMHGYKVAMITGRSPLFTGLTGDTYSADDIAKCEIDPRHIPPVMACECGFYAFKDQKDARYERSINPGSFLMDVDLFGLGFAYTRGFKAEAQRVNAIQVPRRCMRCKTLPAKRFVTSFQMGFNSFAYWRWEIRCKLCSATFKKRDTMSAEEMERALGVHLFR